MQCQCGAPLLPGSTECLECGWTEAAKTEAPKVKPQRFRHDCHYTDCIGPGNFYIDGHWYCRDHIRIIKQQIERAALTPETRQAIAELNKYAEEHGITRREGETKEQHRKRRIRMIKEGLAKIGGGNVKR